MSLQKIKSSLSEKLHIALMLYGAFFFVVIILIAHPKSQNSGIPFRPYVSGKPSARWLSREYFLLLPPLKKYYTPSVDQDDLISI